MAKATASDKDVLNALEQVSTLLHDAERGYRHSAEDVKDADLRSIFEDRARERKRDAEDVDQVIRRLGGTPPSPEGSTTGAAYRMWMDVKGAITGGDRKSVLQEVYRSEAYLEECYDKLLKRDLRGMTLPQDVVQTLQRQHHGARTARDRSRSMLESMGVTPAAGTAGSIAGGMENYIVERPMVGTALAFGIGLVVGCLLSMSMRGTTGQGEGGRAEYGRGRQTGYRYGTEGRTGYGYGAPAYGSSGQTGYGEGARTY